MANIIQIRRDLGANWTSANPILADGELGVETDASPAAKMKIGNATDDWTTLQYLAIDGSRIYNGSAVPSTLYNDHDYYIRTSNGAVYEQQSGAWVFLFTMSGGGGKATSQVFTSTSGQSVYTITGGYIVGNVDVYFNGVRLIPNEFVATNGTSITINVAAQLNDIVEILKYE